MGPINSQHEPAAERRPGTGAGVWRDRVSRHAYGTRAPHRFAYRDWPDLRRQATCRSPGWVRSEEK
eukprot:554069-Prymnesium_polylepis.1